MNPLRPASVEELASGLRSAAEAGQSIRLGGCFTKDRLGGAPQAAEVAISCAGLNRILQYEPRDLTISVEAGLHWNDLTRVLKEQNQMIPLDPPWADSSSVGGVIAANLSGPRRRLYGTARDLVIGMTFVTLEGKVIQSGGMVVKNVAGLDMAKVMIGSWGTLAAIAVVNFKLNPIPPHTRTFVYEFPTIEEAIALRDRLLGSVLQPAAIDLLNPAASALIGRANWTLAIQAGGNGAVVDRWSRELDTPALEEETETSLWESICELPARFLREHPEGRMVPITSTLEGVGEVLCRYEVPIIARAGSGVCYALFERDGPETELGGDLPAMAKIKDLFDPKRLLNRGRLYGRI
jgi:glycolate oxidase FAD binding subunit